ncbi:GNAT family N-acetyltransferase [Weissella coleopterorum]|uniref:GNAT family N-acetyltransferase n=1 Tax=Weissella coleopterorum TaxID=2714949 RepID=A0A6G8AYA7_9LACO|nr:GNAT family N-acetyltransferase [Weissella coleopterorum]QIL50048.1 GNAT family N-acetyltransferase [Weissella coleopterorum]
MALIYLRKAKDVNLKRIMDIIKDAQASLKSENVPQWQDGYPDKNNILLDIKNNNLYEIMFNNNIAGIIAIQYTNEPNYDSLTGGNWENDDDYATIHRLAIDSKYAGNNLGVISFYNAITLIKNNNYKSVRIDTHKQNKRVQYLLKKIGFNHRGTIHINDPHGDLDTNAYELTIK